MHGLRSTLRHVARVSILALAAGVLSAAPAPAAPTWVSATTLWDASDVVSAPQVVMDAAGNATAAWLGYDPSGWTLLHATRPAGGVWSSPEPITDGEVREASARLTVDSAGVVTAAWVEYAPAGDVVSAASMPLGGRWSSPQTLSTIGSVAEGVSLDAGPDGTVVVSWHENVPGGRAYFAATREPAGSWELPASQLSGVFALGTLEPPEVAAGDDGNATVLWNGGGQLFAAQHVVTGWAAHRPVHAPGDAPYSPQLVVDPAGNATAIWMGYSSNDVIRTSSRSSSGDWVETVDPLSDADNSSDPMLVVDDSGRVTAAWFDFYAAGTASLTVASRSPGGPWSSPQHVTSVSPDAKSLEVGGTPEGALTAAWTVGPRSSDPSTVRSIHRSDAGGWGPVRDLSPNNARLGSIGLAADGLGNAVATWSRHDGAGTPRYVEALGLDGAGPAAAGVAVPATTKVGRTERLSVTPSDVWSEVASTAWDFGDGTSATGNDVVHAWSNAGSYSVKVTLTDGLGNSTVRTTPVTVAAAPGPPAPPKPPKPPTTNPAAPEITRLKLKPRHIELRGPKRRTRTKVILRLSEDARVTIRIKPTGKTKKKLTRKQVRRIKKQVLWRTSLDEGRTKLRLTSKRLKRKLGKRNLRPGRYKLVVTAKNTAGKDRRTTTLHIRR